MPKVSIAIPIHNTPRTAEFLARLLNSIATQTFKDYEIVITNDGAMAHNHNAAILKCRGEIVKLMQMDDFFSSETSLEKIVDEFNKGAIWLINGAIHSDGRRHIPQWTDNIFTGNNRLGSLSALSFVRECQLLLEEPLTWAVDCDLYYRYSLKYGSPVIIEEPLIVVDVRDDRLSSTLSMDLKTTEVNYLIQKYG